GQFVVLAGAFFLSALVSVFVSDFASVFASDLVSDLASVLASSFLPSALASGLASSAFLPPLLKSVAYQPEPFSWKPAAVSCLAYFFLPQAGHFVSAGSESFCRWSSWCPQASQRYS